MGKGKEQVPEETLERVLRNPLACQNWERRGDSGYKDQHVVRWEREELMHRKTGGLWWLGENVQGGVMDDEAGQWSWRWIMKKVIDMLRS